MASGHRLDVAAISSAVAGAVTQALRMQQQGEPGSSHTPEEAPMAETTEETA